MSLVDSYRKFMEANSASTKTRMKAEKVQGARGGQFSGPCALSRVLSSHCPIRVTELHTCEPNGPGRRAGRGRRRARPLGALMCFCRGRRCPCRKKPTECGSETHNEDPRTSSWWLMSGPGPLLTILATYLYFCLSIGPRYMRDRKPYNLKNTIIVYNVSQVVMSIFLVYEGLVAGWWEDYSFTCQPVDYSDSPKAKRMAAAVWWYFLAKLIELSDTVFFVLRKKNKQISVLHLYHHFMMPICAWIGTKFLPGGHGTLLGVINSFIHIIMYTYYLISGLGPEYQKYLWWKQHVTTLQLIQFCIVFYHNGSVMFRDCNYPKGINFLLTLNAGIFLYMFGNFYYTNYIKKEIHKKGIPVQKTSAIKGHVIREKIEAVANGKLKDS